MRRSAGDRGERARLLGFVAPDGLDALLAALARVSGPPVTAQPGPALVALLQDETPPSPQSRPDLLLRLAAACEAGAFLPMDPCAACGDASLMPALLQAAWPDIADAFRRHGRTQQWDIVWRSRAAHADAGQRDERAQAEALLLQALTQASLVLAAHDTAAGSGDEVAVTVLAQAGGAMDVQAAVRALASEHRTRAEITLRGPLPPIRFAAVRLVTIAPEEVAAAWRMLGLPARIEASMLQRIWRLRAAALHPDRQPDPEAAAADGALAEITDAWRTLRDLFLPGETRERTLADLLRRAGSRLVVPLNDLDQVPLRLQR